MRKSRGAGDPTKNPGGAPWKPTLFILASKTVGEKNKWLNPKTIQPQGNKNYGGQKLRLKNMVKNILVKFWFLEIFDFWWNLVLSPHLLCSQKRISLDCLFFSTVLFFSCIRDEDNHHRWEFLSSSHLEGGRRGGQGEQFDRLHDSMVERIFGSKLELGILKQVGIFSLKWNEMKMCRVRHKLLQAATYLGILCF